MGAAGAGTGSAAASLRVRQPTTAALNTSSDSARDRHALKASSARWRSGATCSFTALLERPSPRRPRRPPGAGVASTTSARCWYADAQLPQRGHRPLRVARATRPACTCPPAAAARRPSPPPCRRAAPCSCGRGSRPGTTGPWRPPPLCPLGPCTAVVSVEISASGGSFGAVVACTSASTRGGAGARLVQLQRLLRRRGARRRSPSASAAPRPAAPAPRPCARPRDSAAVSRSFERPPCSRPCAMRSRAPDSQPSSAPPRPRRASGPPARTSRPPRRSAPASAAWRPSVSSTSERYWLLGYSFISRLPSSRSLARSRFSRAAVKAP